MHEGLLLQADTSERAEGAALTSRYEVGDRFLVSALLGMSAPTAKATLKGRGRTRIASLYDQLIGEREQCQRHIDARRTKAPGHEPGASNLFASVADQT